MAEAKKASQQVEQLLGATGSAEAAGAAEYINFDDDQLDTFILDLVGE